MRILFLGASLDEHHGWGRYASEVIKRFPPIAHQTRFLALPSSPRIPDLWSTIKKVRAQAKNFDIVHALDGWPYGVYAAHSGRPYFINGVGTYSVAPLNQFGKSYLLKKAYGRAEAVFCISRYTRQEIGKYVKLKNLEVVHLGVDHSRFRSLDLPRSRHLMVGVGALKSRKGYHVALPAVKLVTEKFPDARYHIVNKFEEAGYVRRLEGLVSSLGLKKNVVFTGNLSDHELIKLYNQAELFLLLPVNIKNNFEGFGLVFVEAAACGLPVVGTMGNGGEDAVVNGQNGFLVPQNDPAAAAQAIEKIFRDEALWKEFSAQSLAFSKRFTWEATANHYLRAYQSVRIKE